MKHVCFFVACVVLLGGCVFEHNPYFCKGAPLDNCTLIDAGIDAPTHCTMNQQCTTPMATVCDIAGSMTCVQCTPSESGACTGATPACVSNTCQKCTEHAQCASHACLPDGTCGDDTNVAYVEPMPVGNDNPACSSAAPCATVMKALSLGRPYVKLHGTTDEAVSIKGGRVVTFLADPGAKLTRTNGNGAILTVQDNGTSASVYDLTIANAPNDPSGIGCVAPTAGASLSLTRVTISNNPGGGISVSGGALTVSQSTLTGNAGTAGAAISATGGTLTISRSTIVSNPGGGISVTGTTSVFDISESFIVYNGRALAQPSDVGGAALTANTSGSRFEWNTVAFNESNGLTFRGGLSCNGPMASAAGNLIYHNTEPDGLGGTKTDATTQKNAVGCQFGNSLAVPTDPGNLGFKSPIVTPFDFHLTSASPATIVNAGGACSGVDYDGDMRPIGAACDLGADEYHP